MDYPASERCELRITTTTTTTTLEGNTYSRLAASLSLSSWSSCTSISGPVLPTQYDTVPLSWTRQLSFWKGSLDLTGLRTATKETCTLTLASKVMNGPM